jgi:hypothetical protein
LEAYTDASTWLGDYFIRLGTESTIIPELFVGFDYPNTANTASSLWDSNFNIPVRAALSFSGVLKVAVIEPDTLALFSLGLVGLGLVSLFSRPSHHYRPSTF